MSYTQEFIEKVRDANNVVELFSEYTSFKRSSGGQMMGRCPLPGHNEKTPSFSVSETKQVYHCFGCGKSGTIFDALRELKNLSFPEAVEYLASKAGIPLPENRGGAKADQAKDFRMKLLKVNRLAAEYFQKKFQELPTNHPVRLYAEKRGLNSEIQSEFKIGFATDEWEGLQNQLIRLKAPLNFALALGLIKKRQKGTGTFDLFRNRLMFPIQDHKGDYVGFGGRALEKDQQPKYLNSAESEVFHKASVFYGLHVTGKYIREQDQVVIVEGYMDLLALYSVGIRNVVATLGTALTEQHARLLKRFTNNVVVLFDGDLAGQRAAERSLPILLKESLIPKGITLPDNLDPDDFVAKFGAQALKERVQAAPELFSSFLDRVMQGFNGSASSKVKVMDQATPILQCLKDQRLQRFYMEELANRTGIDLNMIERSLRTGVKIRPAEIQAITPPPPQAVKAKEGARFRLSGAPKAELFLLNLALIEPGRLRTIWESEIVGEMSHPGVQEALVLGHQFCGQNPNEFDKLTAYLMSQTETPSELGLHLGEPFISMGVEELNRMQADCIEQIRGRFKKTKLREIAARMRSQPASEQLKELEQIVNMQKVKRTLKKKTES
jgi:DNA primase